MKSSICNKALVMILASALLLSATRANAVCADQSIIYGQTVNGSLSSTDCTDVISGAVYYADYYQFTGTAGDKIAIQQSSTSIEPWLVLYFPSGNFTNKDNSNGGTTQRIPATSGYYTLLESGTYRLEATSYKSNTTGSYTLTLAKEASATGTLPSAPTNVTATAGDGSATVTFTPGSIGSGTLVNYWAACDIVGDTIIGNSLLGNAVSLPITVTELTNGTAYNCWGLTRSTVGDSAWSAKSNSVTPTATTASVPASGTSVEFYNAGINHYFMTASPDEAVALDNKPAWGWVRTCKTFDIWLTQASAPANASPVCRFFGVFSNGTVGSHFYTVDPVECANVRGRLDWGWGYENDAFYAVKPVGITCPSGTSPVYRVYNNGMGGAPNHRYMANQADVSTMTSQGWVSEGVAMCAPSGTSSGGTTSCGSSGAGGTSIEVDVPPSSNPQTVTVGEVTVTIPEGALSASQKLKVTKLSSSPAPNFEWQETGGVYDIQLGDMHQFDQELTIRMKYDPAILRADIPIESNITAAYWDSTLGIWVAVPMQLDQNNHEVIVKTKHLSLFTWYMKWQRFDVFFKNNINIVYNKSRFTDQDFLAQGYRNYDVSNYALSTVPNFVEDVMAFLIDAKRSYVNFRPPSSPIDVYVGSILGSDVSSATDKFSGIVLIDLLAKTPETLKLVTAHELFHRVQNAYYYDLGGMRTQTWWLEATADYAGDVAAWNGLHLMGGENGIKHKYLEAPLTDTGDLHNDAYATAHFVKYLVDSGADFKQMFEATAGYSDALHGLDLYLKGVHGNDGGLAAQYHSFAKYFVFDTNSPMPAITDNLYSQVAAYQTTATLSHPEGTINMDLDPGYTAKLWGIKFDNSLFDTPGKKLGYKVSVDRDMPIVLGTSNAALDIYVLKGDRRLAGGGSPVGTIAKNKEFVSVEVEKGDIVYVLGVNMQNSQFQVPVDLQPSNVPSITSLSPTQGGFGATVSISGTNFGASFGTVSFNGTAATITSWMPTQINTTVPTGATTGNVVVTGGSGASNGVMFTVVSPAQMTYELYITWSWGSNCTIRAESYTLQRSVPVSVNSSGNFSVNWDTNNGSDTFHVHASGTYTSPSNAYDRVFRISSGTLTGNMILPGWAPQPVSVTIPFSGEAKGGGDTTAYVNNGFNSQSLTGTFKYSDDCAGVADIYLDYFKMLN